ncbi:hypothetical protein KQJ29_27070, partial [Enterococcus sp. S181_ASV_20]|nr:hypothetical protein [Enterococcus sp. S181_ASV_20]
THFTFSGDFFLKNVQIAVVFPLPAPASKTITFFELPRSIFRSNAFLSMTSLRTSGKRILILAMFFSIFFSPFQHFFSSLSG